MRFTITKLGFEDVTGVLRESEGEILYDPVHPAASSIQWRVKVASVLTDASNRDRALQSEEYFDAGRHPLLSFVSRAVRGSAAGMLEVSGDITTVFAYHTDAQGLYDVRSNGAHSWRLKGWTLTDPGGRFEFKTIRPAPYPGRAVAAHVHVSLEGPRLQRRSAGILSKATR